MNTLLAIVAALALVAIGYALGRARRDLPDASPPQAVRATMPAPPELDGSVAEALEHVTDANGPMAKSRAADEAAIMQLAAFAEERRKLLSQLADARADIARYRQIVVDIENNAPPPILDGPGSPDDLKLIVGVGPVLERMLHQLGVSSFRQVAQWSERDIDEVDAQLHEFPGRIRRDGWVTQARALHQSKYGETLPAA